MSKEKIFLGYYIRKTWKNCPVGKTICGYSHKLYSTKDEAQAALFITERYNKYIYDITEVWLAHNKTRLTF